MAGSIADQVNLCLQAFESLTTMLSSQDTIPSTQGPSGRQVTTLRFEDELDRFKVWAANIGAHHRGQRSLDYRLRDASHIRQRVLQFLSKLQSSLAEGKAFDITKE